MSRHEPLPKLPPMSGDELVSILRELAAEHVKKEKSRMPRIDFRNYSNDYANYKREVIEKQDRKNNWRRRK